VLTPDGVCVYASAAVRELLGLAPSRLTGRHLHELVDPEDLAALGRFRDGLFGSSEPVRWVHRLRAREGRSVWVETTGRLARWDDDDAVLVLVSRDVGGRVEAERQAAAADHRRWLIFDSLREGVIVFDADLRVLLMNRAAETLLQRDRSETVGRVWQISSTTDEDGAALPRAELPVLKALTTGAAQQRSLAVRRADGSPVYLMVRAVPITRQHGGPVHEVLAVIDDVGGPRSQDLAEASRALRDLPRVVEHQPLTARELEVLARLAAGRDVREIAAELRISEHTVRGHVKSILQKLHARSQLQAVVIGLQSGLLRPNAPPFEG
jgi:PAS domain S-box-containing protein